MSPLRKILSWLAFGASILSTQACRLVAPEMARYFASARKSGAALPAITERLVAAPWMAWALPSALAVVGFAAVIFLFRSARPTEWKHHAMALISVLLCYSSVMSLVTTILAFVVLPHAFGSI
jgi:hypothetical protein